jgi:hypothetical protein
MCGASRVVAAHEQAPWPADVPAARGHFFEALVSGSRRGRFFERRDAAIDAALKNPAPTSINHASSCDIDEKT